MAVRTHRFSREIDIEVFRADDAAFSPAARNHCCVACLPSGRRQNSLRYKHASNVFGARLMPHKNHFFASRCPGFRVLRGEHSFANGCTGYRVDPRDDLPRRQVASRHSRRNHRIEKTLYVVRLDSFKCFFNFNQALIHHIDGYLKRCGGRALPRPSLQHIQFAVLHGEFEVLHIAIMFLQRLAHPLKLFVNFRHAFRKFA